MQDLGINILFDGNNLFRLLKGLYTTLWVSTLSILFSIILGSLLGVIMLSKNKGVRLLTRIYLEFIRIMPQLVLLFLVYFGLTRAFNINFSGEASAVIVFSLWGIAEVGDLIRAALISVPRHQYESGLIIGLSKLQIYGYIIIPQAIRQFLPNAINLATRIIKTTSLIALIGVIEVLKVGQQIIDNSRFTTPTAALWIYGFIFFLYFILCYPLSLLSIKLEKRWKK